jgi:hypothetical protein
MTIDQIYNIIKSELVSLEKKSAISHNLKQNIYYKNA